MLKQTLFLILLLFITVHEASARSYTLSHEDFVHLSDLEKDQLIIKTMELAVDIESRYEKEVAVYGFNQNRYEDYIKAISKISKLLVDDANADAAADWSTMGKDFIQLLKRPESRCLFAGWVAAPVKTAPGKAVCNHPGKKGLATPESKAYPEPKNNDCKKGDTSKIQCSPVLFGYKKESDQSLFCVDATNGAHNSSYNCMQEALAEGSAQKGDSKEDRLKNLRNRLSQNPEIFKGVQEFTYKTCVCDETDKNINFNKDYHNYMRPHRTCYGLMEMMGETIICEDPKLPMDVTIFKSLRDYAKNKIVKGSDADAFYTNFLKTEVMKSAPEEYKRLCSDGNNKKIQTVEVHKKKEFTCKAECVPQEDKERPFKCTYHVKDLGDEDGEEYELDKDPSEVPKSKDDTKIEIANGIKKKERKFQCDITFKDPKKDEKNPTLTIEITETTATEIKIKAVPVDKGEWKIVWKTFNPPPKKDEKEKGKGKDKPRKLPGQADTTNTDEEEESKDKKEPEEKPKPKEEEESSSESDEDSEEISRPRKESKYKVCAELRKDKDVVKATPDCLDIVPVEGGGKADAAPNKPAPRVNPMGNGGQMPQQQPMPIRGTSDASALGIR
jgi:hypothetical protein